ncbi:tripartite tricarboxylate transporter permease [Lawsonibacter sp. OA9]|uniref:tripartite tricarboxylate transporter permease n=1 Tax=Oscillospiraceae TaxID=216572 RepID=UPI001D6FC639|nr:tripartite tricarboxylate transporter permease [Lawsonibacter sp. OA9]MBS5589795.1 tripartite tricarboxylate transporter permease [Clostridiales bacterium]MCH1980455.1 tripartite tricarboxylate transporter permease [Lawsonibacter sp. OA9]
MLEILQSIFTVNNLLMMNVGVAVGIMIGAMPGLSVAFAVTILMTMTFHMESLPAMYLMLGAYCGGLYGGSITATLINTPGTANAVCTALEGYPLARKGRAGDALKCALVASTIGGLFSCFLLMFFAPQLAKIILKIGSPEYFALCTFGIAAAIGLEGNNLNNVIKGVLSAAFGLILSCVGADPVFGTNRFSFGSYYMLSGIQVVSSMLGAYALCQVLVNCRDVYVEGDESLKVPPVTKATMKMRDILKHWKLILKSSVIGGIVGAVPGTGGAESAMIAYNEAKRVSKNPQEFGNGSIEGILAAEAANNATSGGAMIPMLTLGIPGDTVMAILLSALTMQGITPGANLFSSGSFWVYAVMGGLFLINLFMLLQGNLCISLFAQVSRIPQSIMTPCIVVMCVMGSFAINNNIFECFVMIVFGIIGFFMKKFGFPVTPLCIALVLGKLFETNLRRSLILSKGNPFVFFTRPISCGILILAVFMLFFPIISNMRANKKKAKEQEKA